MARPRSLRLQALIAFLLVALIPTLLLGLLGTVALQGLSALARTSARAALEQEYTRRMSIGVGERARAGDALFRAVQTQALTLAQYASWQLQRAPQPARTAADLAFADPLLVAVGQSTPGVYRTWICAQAGQCRAFPDQATGRASVASDISMPTGVAIADAFPRWLDPHADPDTGRQIMSDVVRVAGVGAQPAAVVGVDILLSNIYAAVLPPASTAGTYDLLLDQYGRLVSPSDAARADLGLTSAPTTPPGQSPGYVLTDSTIPSVRALGQTLNMARQAGLTTIQGANGPQFVAYAPVPVAGWVLAQVVPVAATAGASADVEAAIRQREALFLAGGGIAVVVVAALVALLVARAARTLADPLTRLERDSRRLAQDLSFRLTDLVPMELAGLSRALNEMAACLQASQDEAVRSARLVGEERQRLAREIHDTIAQGLTAVVVQLETAEDILGPNAAPAALRHLVRAREVARDSLAEARRSVWNLRPAALAGSELAQALAGLKPGMEAEGIACTLQFTPGIQLPPDAEDALFRVCQEALANVRKHSAARRVAIELARAGRGVKLTVADDGRGFDPALLTGPHPAGGFGLWAMRGRLAGVGGDVTIESKPGAGTRVTAWVPVGGTSDGAGSEGAGGR